jgi:hypothetical protein
MFSLMDWPRTMPPDLKKALEELECYKFPVQNQDRWAVIREWLEVNAMPRKDAEGP